jgi:thymidine kinase
MNLLAVVHNYESQQKKAILIKPKIDVRFGEETVKSRAGLARTADIIVDENSHQTIPIAAFEHASCVVVDESQFLSPEFVEFLRSITTELNIPVICYGLRTDYRRNLFPGSKRLFELADSVEEIKTVCTYCNRKAVFNLKVVDGIATLHGPQVDLGMEEKYLPVCNFHYEEKLADAVVVNAEVESKEAIH